MKRLLLVCIGFATLAGVLPAQEQKVIERVKVELFFATEHVPKNLKSGNLVDIKMVLGKTTGPRGITLYQTRLVAGNIEVASVTPLEQPQNPDEAVKVKLLVPKELIQKVEKIREQKVTVVETNPEGAPETKTKSVPLRLEMTKPVK